MSPREIILLLWTWTPYLGVGFLWNIAISVVTMLIGTPLGYGLARLRLSGSRLGSTLTAAARVPPTFVLIFYLAYVVPPEIGIGPVHFSVPDWLKVSLALAVAVAGFVSDNALSALRHHRRGETVEALYFIPAWTTYFLIIVMASSTASVIGVPEIVQRANTVIAAVGDPRVILWVYLYTMLWFLAFCWPLAKLMGRAKVHLAKRAGSTSGARMDLADESGAHASSLMMLPDEDAAITWPEPEQTFDVPVTLDSIRVIQDRLEEAAEDILDGSAVFKLSVAVEELVTNLVKYGDVGEAPLSVAIVRDPHALAVELSIAGEAFDPFRDAPAPALNEPIETRPIGGLGIHLITKMIDRAYYRRIDDKNVMRLVMLRTHAPGGGNAP